MYVKHNGEYHYWTFFFTVFLPFLFCKVVLNTRPSVPAVLVYSISWSRVERKRDAPTHLDVPPRFPHRDWTFYDYFPTRSCSKYSLECFAVCNRVVRHSRKAAKNPRRFGSFVQGQTICVYVFHSQFGLYLLTTTVPDHGSRPELRPQTFYGRVAKVAFIRYFNKIFLQLSFDKNVFILCRNKIISKKCTYIKIS